MSHAEQTMDFAEAMERFDPVLGFEVHVELNTATKIFSTAPTAFGDEPNTNIDPVTLGWRAAIRTWSVRYCAWNA